MRVEDWCCFFFFQAEDGIRDIGVTGVQTCALPIYNGRPLSGNKGCNPAICDHQNGWEGFRGSETSPRDKVKYRRISLTRRRKNKHKPTGRSEEHTSELQSRQYLVCRLLLEKKKKKTSYTTYT